MRPWRGQGKRLSALEGPWSDHEPGLHLDEGGRSLHQSDDRAQPALADRLRLTLKVIGWGWFYLSTVLDDFSRYILAWKLCTTMAATDVSDTLQAALQASGLDQVKVLHRPRLLSDNGPSYLSSELGEWLENKGIKHIHGRAYHPMTQGKIERYHRSMKNRILLENYYLPGQLEQSIGEFVEYYNNCRYHDNLRLHQQAIAA